MEIKYTFTIPLLIDRREISVEKLDAIADMLYSQSPPHIKSWTFKFGGTQMIYIFTSEEPSIMWREEFVCDIKPRIIRILGDGYAG